MDLMRRAGCGDGQPLIWKSGAGGILTNHFTPGPALGTAWTHRYLVRRVHNEHLHCSGVGAGCCSQQRPAISCGVLWLVLLKIDMFQFSYKFPGGVKIFVINDSFRISGHRCGHGMWGVKTGDHRDMATLHIETPETLWLVIILITLNLLYIYCIVQ